MKSKAKPKVFIIDDDVIALTSLSHYLESDYELSVFTDPEKGFVSVFNEYPDVLLLDLEMPKKSGFQVLEALVNLKATHHLPVIIFSAHSDEESRRKCSELGAFAFLSKPCSVQELKRMVEVAISYASQID